MKLDLERPDHRAALKLIGGFAPDAELDVPPGSYTLDNQEVTFKFPPLARIVREEGTAGGGFDEVVREPCLPDAAPMLALARIVKGERPTGELWEDCIRQARMGAVCPPPEMALAALTKVLAESHDAAPKPKRTSAKRTGAKEMEVTIRKQRLVRK